MTGFAEARDRFAVAPDWTPWGAPRRAEGGVETAFHHPLILLRAKGAVRVAAPGDVFGAADGLEWSPMPWAIRGRRLWRSPGGVGFGQVFTGDDGRLFMLGDAVCEQLFEGAGLGARGLNGWIETLKRRIAYCEARGILYRHLVIPDNHALRAPTIAGAPILAADRPLMRLLRAGGEALRERVVYPLEALIDGLAKAEVCYPHDVHMTGYGCYLVYRALMATMPGVDPATITQEAELIVREIFVAGDIARSVGEPGRRFALHEPPHVSYKAIIKGGSYRTYQVDLYKSENAGLPRLTLFRTSNSSRLMPYLMRHFSRLAAVATTEALYDLIESERPDVVMAEMPERFFAMRQASLDETDFATPPNDPANAFTALTGEKLPLPRGRLG